MCNFMLEQSSYEIYTSAAGLALGGLCLNKHSLLDMDMFSQDNGSTKKEADITRKLSEGLTVDEISEERKASVHTVRTQLKTIFAKTGARSQTDVVRLAVKASPPIK